MTTIRPPAYLRKNVKGVAMVFVFRVTREQRGQFANVA